MNDTTTIRNLGCPQCGGVLDKPEGSNLARCVFCDGQFFVEWRMEPRYILPVQLPREEVGNLVRDALRRIPPRVELEGENILLDTRFTRGARPVKMQLYYVPFFRYAGMKVGTSPTRLEDNVVTHNELGDPSQGEAALRTLVEIQYKVESKVLVAEIGMVLPGLNLGAERSRQWSLDTLLGEDDFHVAHSFPAHPFRRSELEHTGTVLTPGREAEEVLAMCRRMYAVRRKKTRRDLDAENPVCVRNRNGGWSGAPRLQGRMGIEYSYHMDHDEIDYHADIVGDGVSLYYCPVWKVDLSYNDRLWEVYVDAARRKLLSLEVPVRGRRRPWSLARKSLLGGQVLGWWWFAAARMAHLPVIDLFYSLGAFLFLGVGYMFYKEVAGMNLAPVESSRILRHEDLRA